jgi:Uma2 family endonuclease
MDPSELFDSGLLVPHRFRLSEYHRLVDVGVLGEDTRVELLEGVIAEMGPQGRAHARLVSRLTRLFVQALGEGFVVRPQLPLSLSEDSEPEPDLAVVTREEEDAAEVHPRTALLVVEVAESSLRKDRLLKARIYARAEVPEYWVVDVEGCAVEVYTAPDAAAGCYRMARTLRPGELLTPVALPGPQCEVAELFEG